MVKLKNKMLNLFKEKMLVKPHTTQLKFNNKEKTSKHFPSSIREWINSIYVFNKNSLNSIPTTTVLVTNIIKSYFNLYNKRLERKLRTKALYFRLKKLSSNKFYISNGGFKHTNNKVYINLYVFNRQKSNYLLTLKKWYIKTLYASNKKQNLVASPTKLSKKLISRIKTINNKGIKAAISISKDKYLLIKALNTIKLNKKYNINKFKSLTEYTKNFYKKLIKKSLKKIRMYFYYKQLLHINKSKLNYTYLQYLKKNLEKLYNKNVEFNIINLKKFYLNSDILSESLTIKIARNRRRLKTSLSKLHNKIKIQKKKVFLGYSTDENKLVNNFSKNKLAMQKTIINNLKYKDITGYRLEIKGRITRRFTAARSMSKNKHKGGILDMDSSSRGLSSILLKGNLKSNTQYTKLKSKTRIGSFGIKGWVSGN